MQIIRDHAIEMHSMRRMINATGALRAIPVSIRARARATTARIFILVLALLIERRDAGTEEAKIKSTYGR